ncbi:hypothetical protein Tco_0107835, partial [Tanacetum coccineum]
ADILSTANAENVPLDGCRNARIRDFTIASERASSACETASSCNGKRIREFRHVLPASTRCPRTFNRNSTAKKKKDEAIASSTKLKVNKEGRKLDNLVRPLSKKPAHKEVSTPQKSGKLLPSVTNLEADHAHVTTPTNLASFDLLKAYYATAQIIHEWKTWTTIAPHK